MDSSPDIMQPGVEQVHGRISDALYEALRLASYRERKSQNIILIEALAERLREYLP